MGHDESHKISRSSVLRAAVMGANDGIVSTSSILTGVVAGGGRCRGRCDVNGYR